MLGAQRLFFEKDGLGLIKRLAAYGHLYMTNKVLISLIS